MGNKNKAEWLPVPNKFLIQILLSVWSYLTLPFFHERKNGVLIAKILNILL